MGQDFLEGMNASMFAGGTKTMTLKQIKALLKKMDDGVCDDCMFSETICNDYKHCPVIIASELIEEIEKINSKNK